MPRRPAVAEVIGPQGRAAAFARRGDPRRKYSARPGRVLRDSPTQRARRNRGREQDRRESDLAPASAETLALWRNTAQGAAALVLCLAMIPFWAFGTSLTSVTFAAVLLYAGVQGTWGVIPVHLNELSDSARGLMPGLCYQLDSFRRPHQFFAIRSPLALRLPVGPRGI